MESSRPLQILSRPMATRLELAFVFVCSAFRAAPVGRDCRHELESHRPAGSPRLLDQRRHYPSASKERFMQMGVLVMLGVFAGMNTLSGAPKPTLCSSAEASISAPCTNPPKIIIEFRLMASDDSEQRGKGLRAQLNKTYQNLQASQRFAGNGNDITEAVLPYIPNGTPFSEAESILRSAGFIVGSRPDLNSERNPNKGRDWYAVVASMPFKQGLMSNVNIYVSLLPKSPGDYTTVEKVSATLFVLMP
jgi:hypothetical protein